MTEFEKRMYALCEKLNAPSELLGAIGSYKDGLSDEDVLFMLDEFIAGRRIFVRRDDGSGDQPNYYLTTKN